MRLLNSQTPPIQSKPPIQTTKRDAELWGVKPVKPPMSQVGILEEQQAFWASIFPQSEMRAAGGPGWSDVPRVVRWWLGWGFHVGVLRV